MDRYIECKTQEQWNIVIGHLNKKYNYTNKIRLDYKNDWNTYEVNTVLRDFGNELWSYASKSFYIQTGVHSFISFEEFCKQEGINMKKKSTDYCFKGCKGFAKYISENFPKATISGDFEDTYYYEADATTENCGYRHKWAYPQDKILITWQEFKQLFIDKKMTTQEEINELKTRLQELEEKVKKENEFKVGDYIYVVRTSAKELGYQHSGNNSSKLKVGDITKVIWNTETWSDGKYKWLKTELDPNNGIVEVLVRKATQAEIDEYLAKNKPIEISGYKAEFNKANKTVSFGCKKDITKKDLEAVLTVMKLNEKFEEGFVIEDTQILQDNESDFSGPISKETIQKLINKLEE